jgi:hypothetical protein
LSRLGDALDDASKHQFGYRYSGQTHHPFPYQSFDQFTSYGKAVFPAIPFLKSVNLIVWWQPIATGNPPATVSAARCVADYPANPFPNPPATAR